MQEHPLNASIAALGPMPAGLSARPVSSRGFPIPWFVTHRDLKTGELDFRIVDPHRIGEAWRRRVCWTCGRPLGRHLAFAIGPMCAINRVTSEPASHRECAEYSVRACPFLSRPRARRNDTDMPADRGAPGVMIERNPGVIAIWMTATFSAFNVRHSSARKGVLFSLGEPTEVTWWAEGRPATHAEVEASVASGMPALVAAAELDGEEGKAALVDQVVRAGPILAAAGAPS
jgi:hypothetical protein